MSVSMVKRFRANFLRANVRDGADAVEKIGRKMGRQIMSCTQKQPQHQNHNERKSFPSRRNEILFS